MTLTPPCRRSYATRPAALGVLACALLAGVAPAAAAPAGPERLSDERLETRWARPTREAPVYSDPRFSATVVTRLRFFTEGLYPELYLVLKRFRDERSRDWLQIRLPKRPNGTVGWVPRDALGSYHVNHQQLLIDRASLRAVLRVRGRIVWRSRIGIGKPGTITPAGRFYLRERFRVPGGTIYGTYALGTSAYAPSLSEWPGGGIVGIHGTNQPELLPGRVSHGCIRIRNEDIARLWNTIRIGAPIRIV